jgi:LL-diaminopimelate aminotransferase
MIIQPASRLEHVNEYYFAAKLREIADLRESGHHIINLGIGSPDLPPHPDVIAALQTNAAADNAHGYQSYTGIPVLRAAWSRWYDRHYNTVLHPDTEVLPLIGSKEGIVHIAMAFLEAGDEALVPNPGYPAYSAATLLAGAQVRTYDLCAEQQWLPDLDALAQQDLSRVKLMWVNYPHMPTGAQGSKANFEALVTFGRKHNILIVNDNPYSFILNREPLSILSVAGAKDVAIELNSLSKSLNMAGWRVGAVLGRADYLKTILKFKSNMDSGQFLPVQYAAVAALELSDDWYESQFAIYAERQQVALQILTILGCDFESKQQGLFVWSSIPEHYPDSYALSDELLHQCGVFITPGAIFGSAGLRYIRISLCSPVNMLKRALEQCTTILTTTTQP